MRQQAVKYSYIISTISRFYEIFNPVFLQFLIAILSKMNLSEMINNSCPLGRSNVSDKEQGYDELKCYIFSESFDFVIVGNPRYILLSLVVITMLICVVSLMVSCKKKRKKSFQILMVNLFIQNIIFLLSALIIIFRIAYLLPFLINAYSYFVEMSIICILILQRVMMVCFPIKGNVWITKKRTILALATTYIVIGAIVIYHGFNVRKKNYSIKHPHFIILCAVYIVLAIIIILGNIYLIYKIRQKRDDSIQATNRDRNKKKTTLMLFLISFSSMVTYIAPAILTIIGSTGEFIYYIAMDVYLLLWVDAFVNSVSYLLLQTKIISKLKKLFTR